MRVLRWKRFKTPQRAQRKPNADKLTSKKYRNKFDVIIKNEFFLFKFSAYFASLRLEISLDLSFDLVQDGELTEPFLIDPCGKLRTCFVLLICI